MSSTITEFLSVRQIRPNNFESVHNPEKRETNPSLFESVHKPEKMGNMADVAFGGNTLPVAVNAVTLDLHSLTARCNARSVRYALPGRLQLDMWR